MIGSEVEPLMGIILKAKKGKLEKNYFVNVIYVSICT